MRALSSRTIWIMAILFLCFAFSMLDRQILAILGTPIKSDLEIGDFPFSLLLGPAFAVSYILFGVPFGYLADTWSRPKTIVIGLVTWMVATAACGFAGSFAALFVFRALVGAGEAALSPAAHAIIAENVPRERLSLAMTVYNWGATLGIGLSMILGGLALDQITRAGGAGGVPFLDGLAPWQIIFILMALPGLALAPLALMLPEGTRRKTVASAAADEPFGAFLRKRRWFLICHFVGFGLSNLVVSSTLVWAPQYMERAFGLAPSEVGLTFGIVAIACPIAGSFLVSMVIDWLFKRGMRDAHMRAYFWMLAIGGPFACAGFFIADPFYFWLGIGVIMTVMNSIFGVAVAGLQITTPTAFRARLSGALVSFVNITGAIIGPVLIGAIAEFVFRDESKLGAALGLVTTASIVIALPMLWFGARFMRQAVDDQLGRV